MCCLGLFACLFSLFTWRRFALLVLFIGLRLLANQNQWPLVGTLAWSVVPLTFLYLVYRLARWCLSRTKERFTIAVLRAKSAPSVIVTSMRERYNERLESGD